MHGRQINDYKIAGKPQDSRQSCIEKMADLKVRHKNDQTYIKNSRSRSTARHRPTKKRSIR